MRSGKRPGDSENRGRQTCRTKERALLRHPQTGLEFFLPLQRVFL